VAHYLAKDDAECIEQIRVRFRQLPQPSLAPADPPQPPARDPEELYGVLPADHRLPYEIEDVMFRIFDGGEFSEFQPEYAPEMLCANTRLNGRPVAIIANRRGFLKAAEGRRIGGIVYTESARKVAYFVETSERLGNPLIYLQDVSGFMVGPEAEREGIIRAGAEMVETMSCATVPKIVVTLNHASGAGYYAMAGQGFDPNFTFSWPTARIGVMEGDSAVYALYSAEIEKHKGAPLPDDLKEAIERTRADYERWLDSRYGAARGHCDAIIDPRHTRSILSFALEACLSHGGTQS
jgi:acetyl-CoA carboxylase carboxyltransferase component